MLAFLDEHPDRCIQVRYEALTEQPEAALQPVFDFLGEPWDPSVLDYASREHHMGLEDPDVRRRRRIEPNSGRSAAWPSEVREAVRLACEPALSALGYQ
jgi:hypothetical protein